MSEQKEFKPETRPKITKLAPVTVSPTKILTAAEAGRLVGIAPEKFRVLAKRAGLVPRQWRQNLWSEEDAEVVRRFLNK